MPAALTTSLFIFAAFLILVSHAAAVIVAGVALLWQVLHFLYSAGVAAGQAEDDKPNVIFKPPISDNHVN